MENQVHSQNLKYNIKTSGCGHRQLHPSPTPPFGSILAGFFALRLNETDDGELLKFTTIEHDIFKAGILIYCIILCVIFAFFVLLNDFCTLAYRQSAAFHPVSPLKMKFHFYVYFSICVPLSLLRRKINIIWSEIVDFLLEIVILE